MLLFDKAFSLFQGNDDSSTLLIILNDQKSVWESGWSFQKTPPVGDLRRVLLSDPFDMRVWRW